MALLARGNARSAARRPRGAFSVAGTVMDLTVGTSASVRELEASCLCF
jgi:hypothetical protein